MGSNPSGVMTLRLPLFNSLKIVSLNNFSRGTRTQHLIVPNKHLGHTVHYINIVDKKKQWSGRTAFHC
jgi:hypothetical protein